MPKVFLSSAMDDERLPFGVGPRSGSPSSRRWKALSASYLAGLAACELEVVPMLRPEIYQSDAARQLVGVVSGDWHLAVKPTEKLRPFHDIPNVFHCDGLFSERSICRSDASPFADPIEVLRTADAITCSTRQVADELRHAGITRVVTLPPYVPARAQPIDQAMGTRRGTTFASVVDVGELSCLSQTISAFVEARAQRGDLRIAVIVLGVSDEPTATERDEIAELLDPYSSTDAISVIYSSGHSHSIADNIRSVDFFLPANPARGFPLQLVDAMTAGVPIVTTNSAIGLLAGSHSALPMAIMRAVRDRTDEGELRAAILAAADLDVASRQAMVRACRDYAETSFGLFAFRTGLAQLEQLLIKRP